MALQDLFLFLSRGVTHRDLHQETVELGLGQAVGTFLFNGVLRGDDGVKRLHQVGLAINIHLTFFHHLKEGGLCLGRRAVDLIG